MLKAAGLIVILTASVSAAFINTRAYKRSLSVNEGTLELIRYIRTRILYFHDSLSEIYSDFENAALDRCGLLSEIREKGFMVSVSESRYSGFFGKSTLQKLKLFGKKLGKTSVEEQIGNCDVCIAVLEDEVSKMRAELPLKTRMYSSLCIISGMGAALLLI